MILDPSGGVPTAEQNADVGAVTDTVLAHVAANISLDAFADTIANAFAKGLIGAVRGLVPLLAPIAKTAGTALVELEEPVLEVLAPFVVPIVANLFGTDASSADFMSRANRDGRGGAAREIVNAYVAALTGDGTGSTEPGDAGAKRIAGAAVQAALEGWFNELIPELIGQMVPIDWMHFPAFTGLSEEIIRTLGVGRLVRRAFSPLVDATAATPMKWAANKTYRPTLLGASTVVKQWTRGRWDWSDVVEELARDGYSDERIDALINDAKKFVSLDDAAFFVRQGTWTRDQAVQNLRDQGWDSDAASDVLTAARSKRVFGHYDDSLAAARRAFVDRQIEAAELDALVSPILKDDQERTAWELASEAIRALNVKYLSASQAEECVRAGVLAVPDYRQALEREGYVPEAVDALELLLRAKLDKAAQIDDLRAQQALERAAAKAAHDQAVAARKAQIDAERALHRRGSLAELQRAVVRGLIPVSRYEEVLTAEYDADTVAFLVDLVEHERQDYLDAQQRAADVRQAATRRNVDVGQIEQAVLAHTLTLDEFHARLLALKFAPADADLLTATLAAKQRDLVAAQQKRDQAAADAKKKAISLDKFEQLVERGARTLAEYDALLASLGYDVASRAAIADLLRLKIAERAAAKALRASTAKDTPAKGLTLDQFRRAVILGYRTIDDFQTWLVQNNFTSDAQIVLLAELRDDVAVAEAARQKRTTAPTVSDARSLSLSILARAARLGVIAPETYQARLRQAGYSADDVAIEMELLVTEMADVKAAHTTAATADRTVPAKGLTLAQLAGAVKRGLQTLDDYRARAVTLGLSAEAVNTLVRVLGDELLTAADAQARRATVAGQLAADHVDLAELEQRVLSGAWTEDQFLSALETRGVAAVDAELLGAALVDALDAGTGAAGG